MNLFNYFDITSRARDLERLPLGKSPSALPQWLTLFAGVLIQPYFEGFRKAGVWQFSGFWGWSLFAIITSIIVFPAVYRKTFDPEAPVAVQLGPIFASGLGWQSLMSTALKMTGH
jgi:hypothetical protein